MQGNRGRTWLTESASPVSLVLSSFGVSCVSGGSNGAAFPGQSLADVYSGQCSCNPVSHCGLGAGGGVTDAVADANGDASYLLSADATDATGEGTEAAAEAAAADATGATIDGASSADAGASAGDAPAGEVGEGPESGVCTADPCAGFDDLDVAAVGMHEGAAWITRLRAVLPTDALGEGDLHIQASASQTAIPRQHNVNRYDDAAYSPCPRAAGAAPALRGPASSSAAWSRVRSVSSASRFSGDARAVTCTDAVPHNLARLIFRERGHSSSDMRLRSGAGAVVVPIGEG